MEIFPLTANGRLNMKRLKIAVVAAMVVLTCGGASGDVPVVMPAPDNPLGDVPIVIPGTGGGDVSELQYVSFSVSLGKGERYFREN